jgi:hypothetical protein
MSQICYTGNIVKIENGNEMVVRLPKSWNSSEHILWNLKKKILEFRLCLEWIEMLRIVYTKSQQKQCWITTHIPHLPDSW